MNYHTLAPWILAGLLGGLSGTAAASDDGLESLTPSNTSATPTQSTAPAANPATAANPAPASESAPSGPMGWFPVWVWIPWWNTASADCPGTPPDPGRWPESERFSSHADLETLAQRGAELADTLAEGRWHAAQVQRDALAASIKDRRSITDAQPAPCVPRNGTNGMSTWFWPWNLGGWWNGWVAAPSPSSLPTRGSPPPSSRGQKHCRSIDVPAPGYGYGCQWSG